MRRRRPTKPTRAHAIIQALGGYPAVAKRLRLQPRTVRSWYKQGIPPKYHYEITRLSETMQTGVGFDQLQETVADGQRVRAAERAALKRAARKAAAASESAPARHPAKHVAEAQGEQQLCHDQNPKPSHDQG